MRRTRGIGVAAALLVFAGTLGMSWAGSPHFVEVTVSCSENTVTVSGKEAGLGNEPQVHIVVTAVAECVNPGNNKPKADNKDDVTAAGDFPVQNGKSIFMLEAVATFQPSCSPPMTVEFSEIVVTDETSGITRQIGECP
jgi:hypothetical protein